MLSYERAASGLDTRGPQPGMAADAGYFADLAHATAAQNMAFDRHQADPCMWKALAAVSEDAWQDATGMENAQVAVMSYKSSD